LEFRLLYEGELLPSANRSRPEKKHQIRQALHPQLRRLWNLKLNLELYAASVANKGRPGDDRRYDQQRAAEGRQLIAKKWTRDGYSFVPLITSDLLVRCRLDILLLRPEEDRFVFKQGDIDGQVKTIFDALTMPAGLEQTGGIGPQADEDPFFCLLEDDRLISDVHINSDQLLLLPERREVKPNDSFVLIHVKVNHTLGGAVGRWLD
jgi:hypothetical protein